MILSGLLLLTFLPQAAPALPAVVQTLHTGDVVVQTWTAPDGAAARTWFRMSHDGGAHFSRDRVLETALQLRYAVWDPLAAAAPPVPAGLAAGKDNRLWIVQYQAPGTESWRERIRALGAVDHRFLAWNANIWEMDTERPAATTWKSARGVRLTKRNSLRSSPRWAASCCWPMTKAGSSRPG